MSSRIQVVLSDEEREAFRQQAAAQRMSLSSWLRQAGLKESEARRQRTIRTVEELRDLFASCPDDDGTEPDWEAHLQVMSESRNRGISAT